MSSGLACHLFFFFFWPRSTCSNALLKSFDTLEASQYPEWGLNKLTPPLTPSGLNGWESVGWSAPSLSSILPLITEVWCQQDAACPDCVGHFLLLDKWSGFLCAFEPEVACWALNHRPSEMRCVQGAADKGAPPHSDQAVDLVAYCPSPPHLGQAR